MTTASTLGMIGTGSMGRGAALTALARGIPTWGFDLNPAANATSAKAGGRIAASVAELAAACDGVLVPRAAAAHQPYLGTAGARQFYFKVCSTFDATPAGNIGPVAEALMAALSTDLTMACPAFPKNGRTVLVA